MTNLERTSKISVIVGGLGHDSHSVGLMIIIRALENAGYDVIKLGIQRKIEDFIELSGTADAVLISNMDGHATSYLNKDLKIIKYTGGPLWYIGGHFCLEDDQSTAINFLTELGFDRAFPRGTDLEIILTTLRDDLERASLIDNRENIYKKFDEERSRSFFQEREQVLKSWRTGLEASDFYENAAALKDVPTFHETISKAKAEGRVLIQARSGVPLESTQTTDFRKLRDAGADFLSFQIDSYTRLNDYAGCEKVLTSVSAGKNARGLNGYPLVNHGVSVTRRIISDIGMPTQTRHSTKDPRLLAELSYASGISGFEGGPICYNTPYYRDYELKDSLRNWAYVDKLTSIYFKEHGVVLDREFFGCLTATLVPPCIAIAVNILEALISASYGVKSVSLGYAEQGARFQDIAAIRVLKRLSRSVLNEYGHEDVFISTVFYQFMAGFPPHCDQASALITASASTAAMSNADRIIIKTVTESNVIPEISYNLSSINLVRKSLNFVPEISPSEQMIESEANLIENSVRILLSSVFTARGASLSAQIIDAFKLGFIDIPFSPADHNRGEVLTARDEQGAVRFLNTGRIPFTEEIMNFHREKMFKRKKADRRISNFTDMQIVENDVLAIPRNMFSCWPLDCSVSGYWFKD